MQLQTQQLIKNSYKQQQMNINQYYGCIDLPSEIADSMENDQGSSDQINKNSNIKHSSYYNEHSQQRHQLNLQQSTSQLNLDSSFEDTFLANFPILIQHKKTARSNKQDAVEQPDISVSKTQIVKHVLPSQRINQSVHIINSSNRPVILTINTPQNIQIVSAEAFQKHFQLDFTKNNVKQFYLQAWQKIEVSFQISKKQDEFGDLFQTISLQSKFQQQTGKNNYTPNTINIIKKRIYIEVEVHYVIPSLKISYQGLPDVATVCLNKVSMNKLYKNKLGEYSISLNLKGTQRFQCSIQIRGQLKVFPSQLILFREENKKLTFKPLSGKNKGAVIIRSKAGKTSFVFGVQLV